MPVKRPRGAWTAQASGGYKAVTQIPVDPRGVARLMAVVVASIASLSLAGQFFKHMLGYDYVMGFVPLFDLNGERNVPTWFSSSMLLLCCVLLAAIAHSEGREGGRDVLHWRLLSAIFLFMSVDEAVQIHEQTIDPLRSVFGTGGIFHYAWSVLGLAFVLAFAVVYFPFVARLDARTRRLFVVSGALFVGGALGMEFVQGWHDGLYGMDGTTALITTVEEVLEMSGVVVFVYALLSRLGSHGSVVRFCAGEEAASQVQRALPESAKVSPPTGTKRQS
jgi:hypothetical protein